MPFPPPPPPPLDYTGLSGAALAQPYLENLYGTTCVVASVARANGLVTGLAKRGQRIWTDKDVIDFNIAVTGHAPSAGNKASLGLAFAVWQESGAPLGGTRLAGFAVLDGTKVDEVKFLHFNFVVTLACCDLPLAWASNIKSGFVWDADTGPVVRDAQGNTKRHCVTVVDYPTSRGLRIATNGVMGTLTDAALASNFSRERGGEIYCGLTPDLIDIRANRTPANLKWVEAVTLFNSIAGHQPVPEPPAPPVPPPTGETTIIYSTPPVRGSTGTFRAL